MSKLLWVGNPVSYGSDGAAGLDLRSSAGYTIYPGKTVLVKTGTKVDIPSGYFGSIRDRSSLALKGIMVGGGVVDNDFRGEVGVILRNISRRIVYIKRHDRVAQMVIQPYFKPVLEEAKSLSATSRGSNGFGSTGI